MTNIATNGQMSEPNAGQFTYRYPHPAVTADCCIFAFVNNELSVLLIRRGVEPYKGQWALPGGFMRMDETIEECAVRELREETGYEASHLTQVGAYSSIDRDPRERVVTIAFYALVRWAMVVGGDDADEARWFPVKKLPVLAFDHERIVNDSLMRMRRDVYFEPIGFELLPPTFSMPELQKLIESITGDKYDRRNFYNKMRHSGFITEKSALPGLSTVMSDHSEIAKSPFGSMPKVDYRGTDDENDLSMISDEKFTIMADLRPYDTMSYDEDPTDEHSGRRRRVRYSFNPSEFEKKRKEKGSAPITY